MRQTISVKFFARKDRATASGQVPVFMRNRNGKEAVEYRYEDQYQYRRMAIQDCRLTSKSKDAQRINRILEGFKMKAFDYQRELMNEGKPITLDNFKAKWYGISLERSVMLMEVFKQHNEQMKALVNRECSPLTLERYETSFRHTHEFMKWKYKIEDIDVKELGSKGQ